MSLSKSNMSNGTLSRAVRYGDLDILTSRAASIISSLMTEYQVLNDEFSKQYYHITLVYSTLFFFSLLLLLLLLLFMSCCLEL